MSLTCGVKTKLENLKVVFCKEGSFGKELLEKELRGYIEALKNMVSEARKLLANGSSFMYDTLGESPELKIFISNITRNSASAQFLIGFGCEEFYEISKAKKSDEALLRELDSLL